MLWVVAVVMCARLCAVAEMVGLLLLTCVSCLLFCVHVCGVGLCVCGVGVGAAVAGSRTRCIRAARIRSAHGLARWRERRRKSTPLRRLRHRAGGQAAPLATPMLGAPDLERSELPPIAALEAVDRARGTGDARRSPRGTPRLVHRAGSSPARHRGGPGPRRPTAPYLDERPSYPIGRGQGPHERADERTGQDQPAASGRGRLRPHRRGQDLICRRCRRAATVMRSSGSIQATSDLLRLWGWRSHGQVRIELG